MSFSPKYYHGYCRVTHAPLRPTRSCNYICYSKSEYKPQDISTTRANYYRFLFRLVLFISDTVLLWPKRCRLNNTYLIRRVLHFSSSWGGRTKYVFSFSLSCILLLKMLRSWYYNRCTSSGDMDYGVRGGNYYGRVNKTWTTLNR